MSIYKEAFVSNKLSHQLMEMSRIQKLLLTAFVCILILAVYPQSVRAEENTSVEDMTSDTPDAVLDLTNDSVEPGNNVSIPPEDSLVLSETLSIPVEESVVPEDVSLVPSEDVEDTPVTTPPNASEVLITQRVITTGIENMENDSMGSAHDPEQDGVAESTTQFLPEEMVSDRVAIAGEPVTVDIPLTATDSIIIEEDTVPDSDYSALPSDYPADMTVSFESENAAAQPVLVSVQLGQKEDTKAVNDSITVETVQESVHASPTTAAQPLIATEPVVTVNPTSTAQTQNMIPISYEVKSGNGNYNSVVTLTAFAMNDAAKDTASIQQALDYVKEHMTGENEKKVLVKIPAGTYLINSLNIYSNTELLLERATIFKRNLTKNADVMLSGPESNLSHVTISGGTFDGNVTKSTSNTSTLALISFVNGTDINIRDLVLKNTNAPHAIVLTNCKDSNVDNIRIENRNDAPGGGIYVSGINDKVTNNVISNTKNEAIVLSGTNAIVERNTITDSGINGQSYAIALENGSNTLVINNVIDDSYAGVCLDKSTGNTVTGNMTRWQKSNNSIVLKSSSSNNSITGNTLSKNASVSQDSTSGNNTVSENTKFAGDFVKEGIIQKYRYDDGNYATNQWLNFNGQYYHFDSEGKMQTGWYQENGKTYYLKENGARAKYELTIGNNQYYFNGNGEMQAGWLKFNKTQKWRHYGSDGVMNLGWLNDAGKKYYLNPSDGYRVTWRQKIGTDEYYFNGNGEMQKGWLKFNNVQKWRYYGIDGVMHLGWLSDAGKKYYLNPNDGYRVAWRQKIGTDEYYFNGNGEMQIGWLKFNNTRNWRYYGSDGAMHLGWLNDAGKKYYLNPNDGYRVTWSQKIGGHEYYFNGIGEMHTGWLKFSQNQKWRYYNNSGVMLTGWQVIDKNTYKLGNDGYRYTGWYTVSGADIFADPGRAGNTYYFDISSGIMKKGRQTVDKKTYFFDPSNGVLEGKSSDVKLPSAIPANVINVVKHGAVAGDNSDDTTAFLKAINAVNSSKKTVYVPAGRYMISIGDSQDEEGNGLKTGLFLKSNMNLIMDPNAVLEVKATDLSSDYAAVMIKDVANVNIFGGKIIGDRLIHNGTSGESGHGINVVDSRNIRIAYTTVTDNWGDGIYLSTHSLNDKKYGCDSVTMKACTFSDNRRNNISIIDADNVTIDGCTISNAGSTKNGLAGTAPHAGIDIEPYYVGGSDLKKISIPKDEVCKHIKILSTTINVSKHTQQEANNGLFFTFVTIYNPMNANYISSDDILIQNCSFNGDMGNYSGTNAKIVNTTVKGTLYDRRRTNLTNVKYGQIWAVPF